MSYSKKFILALDVSTESEAIKWVKAFSPLISTFKVGKQLFISQGPRIIEQIRGLGGEVFLDLKLHDIPHTVYKASQSILNHSVFMFNAHALGGIEMLKASAKAVKEKPGALLIWSDCVNKPF
jgi:orotidine-5'-phosphate decarboxylase